MAAVSALPPLAIDMYLPAIPGMAESLETEISVIQNSLSVFLISFGLGMMVFGPFSDRFGRRPLVLFGLAGFGLFSLCLTVSPTADLFLLFRFFQGVLGSAATVVIPAMIRDCLGKDTAKGMSTVTMIMLTAPLVSPLVGSALLTFSSWRAIFVLLTVYSLVVFLLVFWKLPETLTLVRDSADSRDGEGDGEEKESTGGRQRVSFVRNYMAILSTAGIYPHLFTFLFSSMAFFTYLTSAPFIYITWFELSETVFGLLFTTTAASLILANFLNVKYVSRLGSQRMLNFGLASALLGSLVLIVVYLSGLAFYWLAVCFFLIIGSLGIISVNAESLILIEFPNLASSAAAVARTLRFSTGALVGPVLALTYTGTPMPVLLQILVAVGCVLILQLFTGLRQKKAGEDPG